MSLWEKSPKRYKEIYIDGITHRTSREMALGTEIAKALENDEETGEFDKDLIIAQFPKFEMMDKAIEMDLIVGKEIVPIIIKPDTCKKDFSAFKEYKTGRHPWNQRKVDEWGQLTFYATGIYILTKKIPEIELVWAETEIDETGRPILTGNMQRFPTKRRINQIIDMMTRMRKAWREIGEMCKQEI